MLFQNLKLSLSMHDIFFLKVKLNTDKTINLTLFDYLNSPEPSDFKQCTFRLMVFYSNKTEPYPNKPTFLRPYGLRRREISWKKEDSAVRSHVFISHKVF